MERLNGALETDASVYRAQDCPARFFLSCLFSWKTHLRTIPTLLPVLRLWHVSRSVFCLALPSPYTFTPSTLIPLCSLSAQLRSQPLDSLGAGLKSASRGMCVGEDAQQDFELKASFIFCRSQQAVCTCLCCVFFFFFLYFQQMKGRQIVDKTNQTSFIPMARCRSFEITSSKSPQLFIDGEVTLSLRGLSER